MISLRHIASVAWTFLAFMVAAALVLHLRYKPVGEAQYFDTWTGKIRPAERIDAPAPPPQGVAGITRAVPGVVPLERLSPERAVSGCRGVTFAFPAPEPRSRY